MTASAHLQRHALLHLGADAWSAVLETRPDLRAEARLAAWAPARPLVARRRGPGDRPGTIAAGLPLPPSLGKRRIALELPPEAIVTIEPPLPLERARPVVPLAWLATVDAILSLAGAHAITPRVFGGFAWQSLTGLVYVTPASDLDLLWPLAPGITAILAALPDIESAAPGRIDGEVVRAADGGAANWRELARPGDVLIKTLDRVTLETSESFRDGSAAPGDRA